VTSSEAGSSISDLILRSHEVASRRRIQWSLETPSSFETPPAAALRMRAMGRQPFKSQTLRMRSDNYEPDTERKARKGF